MAYRIEQNIVGFTNDCGVFVEPDDERNGFWRVVYMVLDESGTYTHLDVVKGKYKALAVAREYIRTHNGTITM